MIINYKGKEKRITDKTLIYIYHEAKKLNNDMLINDIEAVLYDHDVFNLERTMKRLESAFKNAVYAGIYEAFELEMYCRNVRIH